MFFFGVLVFLVMWGRIFIMMIREGGIKGEWLGCNLNFGMRLVLGIGNKEVVKESVFCRSNICKSLELGMVLLGD